jgi:hypothetical protein
MRDFDALETRASKLKKSEKRKNQVQNQVEIDQKWEKWPQNGKIPLVFPGKTRLPVKFGAPNSEAKSTWRGS